MGAAGWLDALAWLHLRTDTHHRIEPDAGSVLLVKGRDVDPHLFPPPHAPLPTAHVLQMLSFCSSNGEPGGADLD
jgi:hypothetical protein